MPIIHVHMEFVYIFHIVRAVKGFWCLRVRAEVGCESVILCLEVWLTDLYIMYALFLKMNGKLYIILVFFRKILIFEKYSYMYFFAANAIPCKFKFAWFGPLSTLYSCIMLHTAYPFMSLYQWHEHLYYRYICIQVPQPN